MHPQSRFWPVPRPGLSGVQEDAMALLKSAGIDAGKAAGQAVLTSGPAQQIIAAMTAAAVKGAADEAKKQVATLTVPALLLGLGIGWAIWGRK